MMLVDTWAWIELFRSSEKGKQIRKIIEKEPVNYTSMISIAEISKWAEKNKVDKEKIFKELRKSTTYLELSFGVLSTAGTEYGGIRKISKNIGLIDVIIYTSALIHDLKLLTGDPDFEGLPNVEFI